MPVVELAGVTKAYESKVAVRDLSLSIDAGQMFGLAGPERGRQDQLHSHDDGHYPAGFRTGETLRQAFRAQEP